ncbi:probable transporter MCH4 [Aspergillus udagawae]|nr:probable transporter MCH4 [Aspergillus udagawae]
MTATDTATPDNLSEGSSPPSTLPVEETQVEKAQETQTPPPPPNGGWMAWLQVVGAFFLFFNSW